MQKENAFGFLLKEVKDKKSSSVLSVVCALFNVLFSLAPYYIVALIVSKLLENNRDFSSYLPLFLLMALSFLLKVLFYGISTGLSHKATFEILHNIRQRCTEKLSVMPLGDVLRYPKGYLKNTIFERVDAMETPLAHVIPEFTTNLIAPILVLIPIFIINWRMGFASLITIPIGMLCYMGMTINYKPNFMRTLNATKNLNDTSIEYINGIEVIKVFGRSEKAYEKFEKHVKENAYSFIDWMKKSNIFFTFAFVILPATMVSVLPIGILLLLKNMLSIGDMITIIILWLYWTRRPPTPTPKTRRSCRNLSPSWLKIRP